MFNSKKGQQLAREFTTFKQSNDYKDYWKEKRRSVIRDKVHQICFGYVEDVAIHKASELRDGDIELSQNQGRMEDAVTSNDEQVTTPVSEEPAQENALDHHVRYQLLYEIQEPSSDIREPSSDMQETSDNIQDRFRM